VSQAIFRFVESLLILIGSKCSIVS